MAKELGSFDGLLPAAVDPVGLLLGHQWGKLITDLGELPQLVLVLPEVDGQPGQKGSAQRRRLLHGGPFDRYLQDIGLELHQEVVPRGPTVYRQGRQWQLGILDHRVDDVPGLVGNRLQGRPDDRPAVGSPGQAEHRPADLLIPVRGPEPGEGRHDVNSAGRFGRHRHLLGLAGVLEELQAIAEPLDRGPGHEDTPLQGVVSLAVEAIGDRRQEAVIRQGWFQAGVHHDEGPGSVGVLDRALVIGGLAKERCLLVPGNPGNRDLDPVEGEVPGVAVDRRTLLDFRQDCPGDIEQVEDVLVPVESVDIEEHCPAGVGDVGRVGPAPGQLPEQPGVDGAEEEVPTGGLLPGAGHLIENPLDLGGGEVGVDYQPGLGVDHVLVAVTDQLLGDRAGLLGLPDDRVVDRFPGVAVPDDRRLPLVGDPDGGDLVWLDLGLNHHVGHYRLDTVPDLRGVMLHPTRLREVLGEFLLAHPHLIAVVIEDDGPGAGRPLVNCHDILLLVQSCSSFRCTRKKATGKISGWPFLGSLVIANHLAANTVAVLLHFVQNNVHPFSWNIGVLGDRCGNVLDEALQLFLAPAFD